MAKKATADNPDRDALLAARYATLTNRAVTDEGRLFTDEVTQKLTEHELGSGTRRKKRKGTAATFRSAVEGIVGALLFAQLHKEARGWMKHSARPASFSGEAVSHRNFKAVTDGLQHLKLIEHRIGFQGRVEWGDGTSSPAKPYAPRFRAMPKLLKLADEAGVPFKDVQHHFIAALPSKPVRLRATSTRHNGQKQRGKVMRIGLDHQAERLGRDVAELNEFFDQHALRGGVHRGFVRFFNNGDDPAFDWNMGGRLYSLGTDSFQQMSEGQRVRMTIDREPVCEVDIKASWLTIYLGWHKEQLDFSTDPYDRLGFAPKARDVVKSWFTATWGKGTHLGRWPAKISEDYLARTGGNLGADYPVKRIKERALSTYPLLQKWGDDPKAWARLMYEESVAVLSAMLRLKREHSVPSLSVHDSLIVPRSKRDLAKQIMTEEYEKAVRVKPHLTVSP